MVESCVPGGERSLAGSRNNGGGGAMYRRREQQFGGMRAPHREAGRR
jgi:hypothetical protein